MKRAMTVTIVLAMAVSSIGAVGDDDMGHGHDDDSSGHHHGANAPVVAGAREIPVEGTSFKFKPKVIHVQAGEDVTIVLHSKDVVHDLVVKGEGHIVSAKRGKTKKGGLMIDEPGTYKFWCSVQNHKSSGMRGKIIVEELPNPDSQ
jgi:plastocyanin